MLYTQWSLFPLESSGPTQAVAGMSAPLVPSSTLSSSPSARDGIAPLTETLYRVFACDLVQDAGVLLKLCASTPLPFPLCVVV